MVINNSIPKSVILNERQRVIAKHSLERGSRLEVRLLLDVVVIFAEIPR